MAERNTTSNKAWSAADAPDADAEMFAGSAPDDLLAPGELVGGRYEIVDILGEGGFGVVYRAHQREMNRDVAIKTLRRGIVDYDEAAARFRREAMLARHLTHPHTIRLFDFGQTEHGVLYIVMEFLQGDTLEQRIFQRGPMRLDDVQRLAIQIARSLTEAHQNGVVHRDMKPSNVFLAEIAGEKDFVKVLDFGIAKVTQPWADDPRQNKLTRTGTAFGSPAYMAPEQVRGVTITSAVDVYSFGLILIEALTGEQVVDGNSPFDVALKQASPDPIAIPAWIRDSPLGPLLEKTVAKELDERFADAGELLDALEAVPAQALRDYMTRMTEEIAFEDLLHEAYSAKIEVQPEPEEVRVRRRGRVFAIIAGVSLLIAAVAVTLLLMRPAGDESPAPAAATPQRTAAVVDGPSPDALRGLLLAGVVGVGTRGMVSGAISRQTLPRRPLGVTAERLPLPLLPAAAPATPIIALANAYRVLETMPVVEVRTEDARVVVKHPVGLPMTRAAIVASFAGGTEPLRVTLKFVSQPRGATVFRRGNSKPLGQTPLELEVVKARRESTYRFEAWGYTSVELPVSHAENTTSTAHMRKKILADESITVPD